MNIMYLGRKIPFLLFLFGMLLFKAQTGLKITYYDGTEQGFSIENSGKLSFSGSDLLLQTSSTANATTIPTSIIRKIVFDSAVLSVQTISQNTSKYILYPNPSNDYIRIKSFDGEKLQTSIYSMDGKLLHQGNYTSDQTIDISNLKSGVYLIKANNETFKLIKK